MTATTGSVAIGIDVGGTKVLAGAVADSGDVLEVVRKPTPSNDPADIEDVIVACVDRLRSRHTVVAVGVGAAGFVAADHGTVLFAPNLAWRDQELREDLARRIHLPVTVENDATAMAWAEYRFGAGRGEESLVAVTLGTGIGGGLVLDGSLYRGRFGIAGEVGHVRVVPDGRRCGCGNRGCWEQYASGRALARSAQEFLETAPRTATRLLQLAGGDPAAIDGPMVTRAAREGDPVARECLAEVGGWLGQGLADLAAVLDPGRFVIGGGVAEAGELLLDPARTRFRAVLAGRGHRPAADIRPADLGAQAGLVGAADLARRSG